MAATEFSCFVRVTGVQAAEEGVTVFLTSAALGGIDITPRDFTVSATADAAPMFQKAAVLKLTLSDAP